MNFLPPNYTPPAKDSNFFRPKAGENRVRILSSAVIGWQYWTRDGKPVRLPTQPKETPEDIKLKDDGTPDRVTHFWACVVWDYADKRVKTWQITQASIQDGIRGLIEDEDWGDPKEYDIKITREGDKLETKYGIVPRPKSAVPAEAVEAYGKVDIDLAKKLFTSFEHEAHGDEHDPGDEVNPEEGV